MDRSYNPWCGRDENMSIKLLKLKTSLASVMISPQLGFSIISRKFWHLISSLNVTHHGKSSFLSKTHISCHFIWFKKKILGCFHVLAIINSAAMCTGMTQRDVMGREVAGWGGGFRMGNTCTPVADACWCMAKPIQCCKVKNNNKKKNKIKKNSTQSFLIIFASSSISTVSNILAHPSLSSKLLSQYFYAVYHKCLQLLTVFVSFFPQFDCKAVCVLYIFDLLISKGLPHKSHAKWCWAWKCSL